MALSYYESMRAIRAIVISGAAAMSAGCLVAGLRPIYNADQLVQDDRVIGLWESTEPQATLAVERGEWSAYRVAYKGPDVGTETIFAVYLTTIGGQVFADVTVAGVLQKSEVIAPLHVIGRVQISDTTLSVRGLDYDWFTRAAKSGLLARLPHTVDDRQHIVLTGAPEVTRRWLAARLAQAAIYTAPVEFARIKPADDVLYDGSLQRFGRRFVTRVRTHRERTLVEPPCKNLRPNLRQEPFDVISVSRIAFCVCRRFSD